MTKREAKIGTRVRDPFGAVGTITGNVYGDKSRMFVKWDGEDEPKPVHVTNLSHAA